MLMHTLTHKHMHTHTLTESRQHTEGHEDQGPQQGHQDPEGRVPAPAFTLNPALASHCWRPDQLSACNTHSQLSAL